MKSLILSMSLMILAQASFAQTMSRTQRDVVAINAVVKDERVASLSKKFMLTQYEILGSDSSKVMLKLTFTSVENFSCTVIKAVVLPERLAMIGDTLLDNCPQ